MYNWEKLPISWAKKLGFQIEWRSVYKQEWPINNFHLFFEDNAIANFPIVLLWNWGINNESQLLIGAITQKFRELPNTCIFITKDHSGIYLISVYGKIEECDLPLIYTKPAHSTASILWKQIGTTKSWQDISSTLKWDTNQAINDILE